MRNGLIIFGIFVVFYCKAQQIYPLKTDYTERLDYSYLKVMCNAKKILH